MKLWIILPQQHQTFVLSYNVFSILLYQQHQTLDYMEKIAKKVTWVHDFCICFNF